MTLALPMKKNGSIREAFKVFSEIYGWDSRFREINTQRSNCSKACFRKEIREIKK